MASWSLEYTIEVDLENAVVYAKVYGQWTAETAQRYHDEFKKEVQPLLGQPWAKIVDVSNWKTSRNEVTAVVGKHMSWSKANGVALSIYVIDNVSTFRQLNEMFVKGGTKHISHTFRTWQEGEQFLQDRWLSKKRKTPQS